eukprot:m.23922 g.23922  ORF g.23922 m.23922 type:complete len:68 (+) comp12991_c0_seq3:585-788(+)
MLDPYLSCTRFSMSGTCTGTTDTDAITLNCQDQDSDACCIVSKVHRCIAHVSFLRCEIHASLTAGSG